MERITQSKGRDIKLSDKPFSQALFKLAKDRGFRTETCFAQYIGSSQVSVHSWYSGKTIPSIDYLGNILQIIKPNDSELDDLLNPWLDDFMSKVNQRGRTLEKICRDKTSTTPLAVWIDQTLEKINLSQRDLSILCGIHPEGITLARRSVFSYSVLAAIYRGVQSLDLSPEEKTKLADAIYETIKQQLAEGKQMSNSNPSAVRTEQKFAGYPSWTGPQAAKHFGITRQAIRNLRMVLGIKNVLLTEEDMDKIKQHRKRLTRD